MTDWQSWDALLRASEWPERDLSLFADWLEEHGDDNAHDLRIRLLMKPGPYKFVRDWGPHYLREEDLLYSAMAFAQEVIIAPHVPGRAAPPPIRPPITEAQRRRERTETRLRQLQAEGYIFDYEVTVAASSGLTDVQFGQAIEIYRTAFQWRPMLMPYEPIKQLDPAAPAEFTRQHDPMAGFVGPIVSPAGDTPSVFDDESEADHGEWDSGWPPSGASDDGGIV